MASRSSQVVSSADGGQSASPPRRLAFIRFWAWVAIAAQVVFVASVLVAASWQGPRYSVLAHSVSDMYAVTAPHASFLVQVLTDCGAAVILFALLAVWPMLRTGGRAAAIGSVLLALSVGGLGDLLTPTERLACRLADPGCTSAKALSNTGGKLDSVFTTGGILLLVLAGFFLAHAMQRIPSWHAWARPARWTAVLILVFVVVDVLDSRAAGLFERLAAFTGAAALAVLAVGILRRSRTT
jgi:hypothetical protein